MICQIHWELSHQPVRKPQQLRGEPRCRNSRHSPGGGPGPQPPTSRHVSEPVFRRIQPLKLSQLMASRTDMSCHH